jgi:hypothetical protein
MGQNACNVGGLAMLMQTPKICHDAALECVPMGGGK